MIQFSRRQIGDWIKRIKDKKSDSKSDKKPDKKSDNKSGIKFTGKKSKETRAAGEKRTINFGKVFQSIQFKFILSIVLAVAIISYMITYTIGKISNEEFTKALYANNDNVNSNIVTMLKESKNSEALLTSNIKNQYGRLAAGIASLIKTYPDLLDKQKLEQLTSAFGIQEIHITDGEGIIQYSNGGREGFDLSTTEQTKQFLMIFDFPTMVVQQDPMRRGFDNEWFQYFGAARKDAPGIVMLGITPSSVRQQDAKDAEQSVIDGIKAGEGSYSFVMDLNGKMIAHNKPGEVYKDFTDQQWLQTMLYEKNGTLTYFDGTEEVAASYRNLDDRIIVTCTSTKKIESAAASAQRLNTVLTILLILIISIMMFVLSEVMIIRPIRKLRGKIRELASGNLAVPETKIRKDEFGELDAGFNTMVANMRQIIGKIVETSEALLKSTGVVTESLQQTSMSIDEVTRSIAEVASGAESQARDTEQGVTATDSLSDDIDRMSQNIEKSKSFSDKIEQVNEDSMKAIALLNEKTNESNNSTKTIFDILSSLNERAKKAGKIIMTIDNITNQISLLSLNAAIEAARAGEAGRGFSVVAEEVKRLSEMTADSSKDIEEIIKAIQSETEAANQTMKKFEVIIGQQNDAISNTEKITNEISASITNVVNSINEVAATLESVVKNRDNLVSIMESMSSSAEQTAASTEEVSAATEEQMASIQEIASLMEDLNAKAEELKKSIEGFKM